MQVETDTGGPGEPVLFLPGSYSTARAWQSVMAGLGDGYRMVSTSLPGYGETPERRDPGDCRMQPLVDFVADLADTIGGPFHLVGHSFGGQIALAAALTRSLPVRSLVTFEANPIYARPDGAAFSWRPDTDAMFAGFEAAVAQGDPEAAGIIIDYWSAPGTFAAMPGAIRAFCAATAETNLLDWRSAQEFTPRLAEFAALDMPCTICRGARANPAIVDVSLALGAVMPDSGLEVVDGADHFLISTHPEECAAIVARHLRRVAEAAG